VTRNANEAMVVPVWGLVESVFRGSLELGGMFFVCAFGVNLASVAVKTFSRVLCVVI
jgi:hypothetical protein